MRHSTQTIFSLVCGSCTILLITLLMNRAHPFVGHDFRYFIPRLIDTDLHIRLNGFSIQWYTPSFGGGLPAFPNPQHIEYSVVQALSLFINPWSAILVSTIGISLLGYYFFYRFLNEKLEINWMSSTLGAMFFIGNGFYVEHLIVGHLGYQLFPLASVVLYTLMNTQNRSLYNGAIIALVIVLMIHQAGFYLIIILGFSFGILLAILFLYKPERLVLSHVMQTSIWSIILAIAISGSKIFATLSFMRFFPREVFDSYNVGLAQAVAGLIAQLFGVNTLAPISLITQINPDLLSGALGNITGSKFGVWETDIGLSPVLVFFLFMGLARWIANIRTTRKLTFNPLRTFMFLILVLILWITVETTLARGIIYSSIKELPVLRSLHTNVRFASSFILPLTTLGAIQLNRFLTGNGKLSFFLVLVFFTIVSLLSYFSLSSDAYSQNFDLTITNATYLQMKSGQTFPITHIADIGDWDGFREHATTYKPYEPIFGYSLETFTPEIQPGEILETRGSYFNMTNPASLVFPDVNQVYPFERIKTSERDKIEVFLERRQPDWKIPPTQKNMNRLSEITVIFVIGVLFIAGIESAKIVKKSMFCVIIHL